jgi:DnaK suppressor protein
VIALADLERRLADLHGEIAEALGSAAPVELDQTTQGRLSRMDAMQQQAMAANRIERLRLQERKLEAAIARHREGTYGICCRCGGAVEPERLRLDPATPFCMACVTPAE